MSLLSSPSIAHRYVSDDSILSILMRSTPAPLKPFPWVPCTQEALVPLSYP